MHDIRVSFTSEESKSDTVEKLKSREFCQEVRCKLLLYLKDIKDLRNKRAHYNHLTPRDALHLTECCLGFFSACGYDQIASGFKPFHDEAYILCASEIARQDPALRAKLLGNISFAPQVMPQQHTVSVPAFSFTLPKSAPQVQPRIIPQTLLGVKHPAP